MSFDHEVESAFQKTNFGTQSAWGTAATVTNCLGYLSGQFTPKQSREAHTFTGQLLPSYVTAGREWSEITLSGLASTAEMETFLGSGVNSAAQTDPTMFTIEHGGLKAINCAVSGWSLEGDPDNINMTVNLIGGKATSQTLTGGKSPLGSNTICEGKDVSLTIDDVAITKLFKWNLSVSNLWTNVFFVGDEEPANIAQGKIDASFSATVEADSTGISFLSETDRIACVLTLGTTYPSISFDLMLEEPESFSDADGVYAIGLKGRVMHKGSGNAIDIAYRASGGGGNGG